MTKSIVCLLILSLLTIGCIDRSEGATEDSREEADFVTENGELKRVKEVALSFHEWNIKSILDDTYSSVYDFEVEKSEDGTCKLDSTIYFSNLRSLGTVSEKFIQSEWDRVNECTSFLSTLDWEVFQNADAYEFQEYCNFFYHHYWTRSQEAFHGVEVKEVEKEDDFYLVTLVFFHQYEEKLYAEGSLPVVKVEKENEEWKITGIYWA